MVHHWGAMILVNDESSRFTDIAPQRRTIEQVSKFIEDFKEKSPFCVECGLQLAEKSQTAVVRHFGLQILEHVVKCKRGLKCLVHFPPPEGMEPEPSPSEEDDRPLVNIE
ncbi:Exportin-5 [Anabarilius grahami]|uniref:Exportin-5 n=1 Tax=Anabarilius grahami TaxID=495550 RepID=A0A3N0XTE2_ANAGA|nr:Exportin-5 [Anabarilius grahami]